MGGRYGARRSCAPGSYGAKNPANATSRCSPASATRQAVNFLLPFIGSAPQREFVDPPNTATDPPENFPRPETPWKGEPLQSPHTNLARELLPAGTGPAPANPSPLPPAVTRSGACRD